MQETTLKFNRGDVAEGILGATLVAKFINRPKNLNDSNVVVTKKMINDVLDDFFKKSSSVSYNVKDIVSKKGRFAVDNIKFGMSLPLPAFTLLQQSNQRNVVDDLYDSAIDYVEKTWKDEVMEFATNGKIDDIIIASDGVGDQKGTKADIKITVDGKPYRRQISLKVKGGDQFAQVSGHDFSKQIELWEKNLKLNVSKLKNEYNKVLTNYDKTLIFSSREDVKVREFNGLLKEAVSVTYKEATKQINNLITSNNNSFFENLAKLILEGATKGETNIELVKLEKRTFKQRKFDSSFIKIYSQKLKNANLKVVYKTGGDPAVEIFAGTPTGNSKKNLVLRIRPKVSAESTKTKAGKMYRPYLRNIIESGPVMFSL
jgi:6-pyruvoyl-tetrahydropterin synthase